MTDTRTDANGKVVFSYVQNRYAVIYDNRQAEYYQTEQEAHKRLLFLRRYFKDNNND